MYNTEYMIVFHYKPGEQSSIEQSEEIDRAKRLGLNITVLDRQVFDDEEIRVPTLYLIAAHTHSEPEVVDEYTGVMNAEEILEWITKYDTSAVSR